MGFVRDVVGGITGSDAAHAAKEGGKLQYQASMAGIDAQQKALEQQRHDLSPFRNLASRDVLNNLISQASTPINYSFDPSKDPLLQAAMDRTTKSVLDAKAASGKLGSGGTLVDLNNALAGTAMQRQGQVFDQQYNAHNQRYNQLQNLVSMAQNAAAGQGAATANATNNITSLMGQGANSLSAGNIGANNARAGGTNNLLGLGALALYSLGFSDVRLKEDIKPIGKMDDGTPIYTYKYKGAKGTFVGVMAQELMHTRPELVSVDGSGMLKVNYGAL